MCLLAGITLCKAPVLRVLVPFSSGVCLCPCQPEEKKHLVKGTCISELAHPTCLPCGLSWYSDYDATKTSPQRMAVIPKRKPDHYQ